MIGLAVVLVVVLGGTAIGFAVSVAVESGRTPPPRAPSSSAGSPVLVVKGFNSRWDGVTYRWVRGEHLIRRFSYRGLGTQRQPLTYERGDTHRGLVDLAREMRDQVVALRLQSGDDVSIVAESEGALVTQVYLAAFPHAPVDAVVLLSPLAEPGRVYYPPPGEQGWGVGAGVIMRGIAGVIGALGPVDVSADAPLFRSIVDLGPTVGSLLACPPPGIRSYAVLPIDEGVAAPAPVDVGYEHQTVAAFHGGLLGDDTTATAIADVLDGRQPDDGSGFWAAVGDAFGATAAAWQIPGLAQGLEPAWRIRPTTMTARRSAPSCSAWSRRGANRKRLIASTTQAGLSLPSISTVLRVITCTPPGTSSTSTISHAMRRARPDRRRSGEADLVRPVVDAHRRARHPQELGQEQVRDRQRQVAVRDRAAERTVLRPLRVDVDPLVVAGRVGEAVDPLLGDLDPVAVAEVLPLRGAQVVCGLELGHRRIVRARLSLPGRRGPPPVRSARMDLRFSDEDEAFRRDARDWLNERLTGEFAVVRGRGGPGDEHELFDERAAWERELGSGGWIGIGWPQEYGGRGLSLHAAGDLLRGVRARRGPGRVGIVGEGLLGPTIVHFGDDAQKRRFLPGSSQGTEIWCQGYSEPNAGSDLANVQTRAEQVTRRRRVGHHGPEGVDVARALGRLVLRAVPHRSRRTEAQGALVPARADAPARHRDPPDRADHRHLGVQRGVLRRGAHRGSTTSSAR